MIIPPQVGITSVWPHGLDGPLTISPPPLQSLPVALDIVFGEPLFDLVERLVVLPPARSGDPNVISEAIGRLYGSCGGIMSGPSSPMGPGFHFLHMWGGGIHIHI